MAYAKVRGKVASAFEKKTEDVAKTASAERHENGDGRVKVVISKPRTPVVRETSLAETGMEGRAMREEGSVDAKDAPKRKLKKVVLRREEVTASETIDGTKAGLFGIFKGQGRRMSDSLEHPDMEFDFNFDGFYDDVRGEDYAEAGEGGIGIPAKLALGALGVIAATAFIIFYV